MAEVFAAVRGQTVVGWLMQKATEIQVPEGGPAVEADGGDIVIFEVVGFCVETYKYIKRGSSLFLRLDCALPGAG